MAESGIEIPEVVKRRENPLATAFRGEQLDVALPLGRHDKSVQKGLICLHDNDQSIS